MKKLRLGIVGCGKVTDLCYLPMSSLVPEIEISVLVDTDASRVAALAEMYSIPHWTGSIEETYDKLDAVIIALPNHLHAPVSIEYLKRGIHVLVEKPMAINAEECTEMIEAAGKTKSILAVAHMRRYYPLLQYMSRIIQTGIVGDIQSFDFSEGTVWRWESMSDYRFKKEKGGGIFADMGSHLIDTALWWFGDIKEIKYFDDSRGGVEANFSLEITLPNNAKGTIEVSTNRQLRNSFKVIGDRGTLECGTAPHGPISLRSKGTDIDIPVLKDPDFENFGFLEAFAKQYRMFYKSIADGNDDLIPNGYVGRRTVEIIEMAFQNRNKLLYPWE